MKCLPVLLALAPLAAAACDGVTGSGDDRLAIRFATSAQTRFSAASGSLSAAADELVVTGTNGTLRIQDVRVIVSKFELEQVEGSCGDDRGDDDCEEFEAPPALLDLPLGGGAVTVAVDQVPPGTYSELEFEVEDLDADDGDDAGERQAIQGILSSVRAAYPAFPRNASMVVQGTFTPAGGAAQPFVVYFDAEIEVEKDLVPPVTVPGTDAITVNVDPARWFTNGAQVVNLAALNGRLVEFEVKIREGFGKVEHDD